MPFSVVKLKCIIKFELKNYKVKSLFLSWFDINKHTFLLKHATKAVIKSVISIQQTIGTVLLRTKFCCELNNKAIFIYLFI